MDVLLNDFGRSMSYDCQHYASNDSGLSSNSNGPGEIDLKYNSFLDFQSDDLTKSLFINSIGGNELINDDDIYSYKSKLEIQGMFTKKYHSFNFPKSENLKLRNLFSFNSVIQDLENLKESEPLCKYPLNIPLINLPIKEKATKITQSTQIFKPNDDFVTEIKSELVEKVKLKKSNKKSRNSHNQNGIQEYVSSSIKNYKGNQSLNDIVKFIQGTSNSKSHPSKSKLEKTTVFSIRNDMDIITNTSQLSEINNSGVNGQTFPEIKQSSADHNIINDNDSGTQSHFVSLNNSDEDTHILFNNDFKEVLPRGRKKQMKQILNNDELTLASSSQNTLKLTNGCAKSPMKISQKNKTVKPSSDQAMFKSYSDLLDTKDSFQKFLSDKFSTFMQHSIMIS